MLIEWMIIFCAILGFSIAAYLYFHKTKRAEAPLVCPIGHSCDPVIHSKYAKTMGVENTLLGMGYYASVAGAYKLMVFHITMPDMLYHTLFVASALGFVFSLYLIYIQAFVLKNWCSWCVTSATLTTLILVLSYIRF